ncbi:MAG: hypothetical protein IJZ20_03545 [Clostridia bacterium]|nr:hypothetical protein [Clostridia bacterium]
MSDISKIDKNFAVSEIAPGGEFYSVDEAPFVIYGVMKDEKGYYRVPQDVADATNEGVSGLTRFTAGGIIRFSTNSKKLAIKANHAYGGVMPHMAALGSNGFSVYEDDYFLCSFFPTIPPSKVGEEKNLPYKEGVPNVDGFHDITVYMPLYGAYNDIMVKVEDGAEIRPPKKAYRNEKPVVFYGSSITEGGCASTPAMGFTNIISRDMNLYCLNLGFSGSARGEYAINEYMANLDMSVFVLDYDHNSPTAEYLEETHERVYKSVRATHPDIPIVIASSIPVRGWSAEYQKKRREVIFNTYKNAVEAGDKNVYFLNGEDFFSEEIPFSYCTVDGCHPNDVGMLMMAKGFEKVLVKVI